MTDQQQGESAEVQVIVRTKGDRIRVKASLGTASLTMRFTAGSDESAESLDILASAAGQILFQGLRGALSVEEDPSDE